MPDSLAADRATATKVDLTVFVSEEADQSGPDGRVWYNVCVGSALTSESAIKQRAAVVRVALARLAAEPTDTPTAPERTALDPTIETLDGLVRIFADRAFLEAHKSELHYRKDIRSLALIAASSPVSPAQSASVAEAREDHEVQEGRDLLLRFLRGAPVHADVELSYRTSDGEGPRIMQTAISASRLARVLAAATSREARLEKALRDLLVEWNADRLAWTENRDDVLALRVPQTGVGSDLFDAAKAALTYYAAAVRAERPPLPSEAEIERLATMVHDAYEQEANASGWRTNPLSRVPWADVPEENRRCTRAVVRAILSAQGGQP